jgi:hypothetical protein
VEIFAIEKHSSLLRQSVNYTEKLYRIAKGSSTIFNPVKGTFTRQIVQCVFAFSELSLFPETSSGCEIM